MSGHIDRRIAWDLIALARAAERDLPGVDQTARTLARSSRRSPPSRRLDRLAAAWRYLTS